MAGAGEVRNGYLPERELHDGGRPGDHSAPEASSYHRSRTLTFRSAASPSPYVRNTRALEAALPWLYLQGVSSGEMGEALKVLVDPQAQGLSASTVSRLKQVCAQEKPELVR